MSTLKERLRRFLGRAGEGNGNANVKIEGLDEFEQGIADLNLPPEVAEQIRERVAESLEDLDEMPPGASVRVGFKVIRPPKPLPVVTKLRTVSDAAEQFGDLVARHEMTLSQLRPLIGKMRKEKAVTENRAVQEGVLTAVQSGLVLLNSVARQANEAAATLRTAIQDQLPGVQGLDVPEPPKELAIPGNFADLLALFPETEEKAKQPAAATS